MRGSASARPNRLQKNFTVTMNQTVSAGDTQP